MKLYSKHYVSFLLLLLATICSKAQNIDSLYQNKLASSFQKVIHQSQEKVYLHTDKPHYFAGDTIWVKAYLVNAISHFRSEGSRYIYIELVNRKDKVVKRSKIVETDKSFEGYITLAHNIDEGDYYLRAYTYWMLNDSSEYFYHKNIQVHASQPSFMNTDINYKQNKNKRFAEITFHKTGGGVFSDNYVDYMIRTKKSGNNFRQQKTNQYGKIIIEIPPKEELDQYIYVILEDRQLKHKKTFFVPNLFDYNIDFFPEGGELIAETTQKIAFKSQASDGSSLPVRGSVLNEQGDTITHFRSLYGGIGNFLLSVLPNKCYKVITWGKQDSVEIQKEFILPKPVTDKFALSVNTRKSMAYYNVLHSKAIEKKDLYLLGHIRGFLLFVEKIAPDGKGTIDLSTFPEGILSLVLLDELSVPYSERLVFIRHDYIDCSIIPDKTSYGTRVPVALDIQLKDKAGNAMQGDFSLSVTDNNAIGINPLSNNILSYLLLTSDLKGYIETPGYYFKENTNRTNACLDNLMLTHGWSRFNIEDILKDRQKNPQYYMERGQFLSGEVKNIHNKPVRKKQVIVKVNGKTYPPVQTNEEGIFTVDNILFKDTAVVEAFVPENEKAFRSKIKIFPYQFPNAENVIPYHSEKHEKQKEYIEEVQSPYIKEDGVLVLRLPEVIISSKALVKDHFSSYKMDDEEMLQQQNTRTAFDLVREVPGFQVIDNRPYLYPKLSQRPEMLMSGDVNNRNSLRPNTKMNYGRTVRFMLDNRGISYDILSQINSDDIVGVHKIDPEVDAAVNFAQNMKALEDAYNEALASGATLEELDELEVDQQIKKFVDGDHRTSGGCIILTSRTGKLAVPSNDSRKDKALLLGISQYKKNYVPKYSSPNVNSTIPDNRTTIHWQPRLTFNEAGAAHVKFFTADRPSFYTVIIEGITDKGIPCHYEYLLKR